MGPGRGGWSHEGGGFGFRGPGAFLLRGDGPLAEKLKLTGSQRQKLREIGDGWERRAIQGRADLKLARLDLARLVREDSPNRTRIESQIDTIAKLRADMMKAAIRARLDARDILTAEQRKQLDEARASRGPARGDWR
jgi:Spy/CpxP family protein refolding chaperone